MTTVILWVLRKCRCSRIYDASHLGSLDVLLKIWETLLIVVCGQYDNMYGSPENVHKRRTKLLHFMEEVSPLCNVRSRASMELLTSMNPFLILVHHGNVPYQGSTPLHKLFLYVQVLVYIQCLLFFVVSL